MKETSYHAVVPSFTISKQKSKKNYCRCSVVVRPHFKFLWEKIVQNILHQQYLTPTTQLTNSTREEKNKQILTKKFSIYIQLHIEGKATTRIQ